VGDTGSATQSGEVGHFPFAARWAAIHRTRFTQPDGLG